MKQFRLLTLLALLLTAATGAWATTPNSIVINGTPQVGDKSISLTYHFDPNNVSGITSYIPTLKVKCAADNKWDETNLSLHEVSSGTTIISLSNLGEFEAGKTYEVCFAYNNGSWVDDVFQTFVPAAPPAPKHLITDTYAEQTRSLEQPLPYATTIGALYDAVTGESFSDLISDMTALEKPLTGISSNNTSVVSIGEFNDANTPVTVKADGEATVAINFSGKNRAIHVIVVPPLYVTMADGTADAYNWTATVGTSTNAKALPIGGLKGDGSETVTLKYNGRLKVKGVKATSDAAPAEAVLSITSPSVGQVIGSDGKNYAYGSLPSGVTAVAKICYVSGSNGLALALTDEKSGSSMNWSTAQTTCAAHTAPFTGGTWKLASKDEWINMIAAAGSDLRDGFSSVGGTNMQEGRYWSSTEYESVSSAAYYYDFYNLNWNADNKNSDGYVRACLAF